jgi:hypothetical protein
MNAPVELITQTGALTDLRTGWSEGSAKIASITSVAIFKPPGHTIHNRDFRTSAALRWASGVGEPVERQRIQEGETQQDRPQTSFFGIVRWLGCSSLRTAVGLLGLGSTTQFRRSSR